MTAHGDVYATLAGGLTRDVVLNFGEVRIRALGTSMAPSILPGDLISIQRASIDEIALGEVVLVERQGRLCAHRVIASSGRCDGRQLITRGDRLRHSDPPVLASEVLGRVTTIERASRRVPPPAPLTGWKHLLARLLRSSDYATYVYVNLASRWRRGIFRRAECRP